jgi:hypothetical protein
MSRLDDSAVPPAEPPDEPIRLPLQMLRFTSGDQVRMSGPVREVISGFYRF